MKHSHLVLIGAFVLVASLPTQGAPPAAEPGKALLLGTDTAKARVLFRKIDDGPVLWHFRHSLGTKLSVDPGHHNLNVLCHFNSPGVILSVVGNVEIDVEAGQIYDVAGDLASDQQNCDVVFSKHQ
jgi:hypothetical protein